VVYLAPASALSACPDVERIAEEPFRRLDVIAATRMPLSGRVDIHQ